MLHRTEADPGTSPNHRWFYGLRRWTAIGAFALGVPVALAACVGDGDGGESLSAGTNDAIVTIHMTDYAFSSDIEVPEGEVTLRFENDGEVPHSGHIFVESHGDHKSEGGGRMVVVNPGDRYEDMQFTFEAGRDYELMCHEPGHLEQGMEAPITVIG